MPGPQRIAASCDIDGKSSSVMMDSPIMQNSDYCSGSLYMGQG